MKSSDSKKTLENLLVPFEAHQISKLPKPYKKDSPKGNCTECGGYHGLPAVHLDYVGHAALTLRLLETDINWTWEPMGLTAQGLPALDESGGLWIKLTVLGQTRIGYGSAPLGKEERMKELIGDALRNAAMRFGAALDLWHKGDLHKEDGSKDDSEEFTFKAGQHSGVCLHDWTLDQILAYLDQINAIKKKPKEVVDIIAMIEKYLKKYGP